MKTNILIFFLLFTSVSFSQIIESSYFSEYSTESGIDHIKDYVKVDDGIIICGMVEVGSSMKTGVVKVNLQGNIVWSTLDSIAIQTSNNGIYRYFNINLFSDGFIYGLSKINYNEEGISIKINPVTGEIIWTKPYYEGASSSSPLIYDYDSLSYFLLFSDNTIAEINKLTGDTLKVSSFPYNINDVITDYNGNVYVVARSYSYGSDLLVKFNGKNFNEVLWEKAYSKDNYKMVNILKIYIDNYNEIFLFGMSEDNLGPNDLVYITKIDQSSGDSLFTILGVYGGSNIILSARPSCIIEDMDKIYASFQHLFTGGGDYYSYTTIKFDKNSGVTDWLSKERPEPLNSTLPNNKEQSALSMDIDCSGDIYLSGYYGSSNYDPAEWGIIKLNGEDGSKAYDLTITNDSTSFDLSSSGKVVCVYGNTPLFLGHLQTEADNHDFSTIFATIDVETGELIQKKQINNDTVIQSATINIINDDNNIYMLKQLSKKILIEKYNSYGNFIWRKKIETSMLFARNITISNDNIYISANNNSLEYFDNSTSNKIIVYKLNALNGSITDSVEVDFGLDYIQPVELEADLNTAFIFYQKNDSIFYCKWEAENISAHLFLDTANYLDFNGNIDIIYNNGSNLLAAGSLGLYEIDKTSLSKSQVYTYVDNKLIYDLDITSDTIFMCGKTNTSFKNIFAINKNTMNLIWDKYYDTGCLYKIKSHNNMLYTIGNTSNTYQLYYLLKTNGDTIETYNKVRNSIETKPLDIEFNIFDNTIEVTGYSNIDNSTYNGFFDIIDIDGNELYSKDIYSEEGRKSYSKSVTLTVDSCFLVGGATNELQSINHGFVLKNKYINLCLNTINISIYSYNNATMGICNGNILANASGGVPPYLYQWNTGENTSYIDNLCPNSYYVYANDSNNCVSDTVLLDIYPDTVNTFVDTSYIYIDTCLFNTALPVDSAFITDFELINSDSVLINWIFWQEDTPYYLEISLPYSIGNNLVYLEIVCNSKSINIYRFYGIFNSIITEIHKIRKIKNIIIYPNPADNFLNIKIENNESSHISITDITGKTLVNFNFTNQVQINTKEWNAGIYLLKIKTNNKISTKKIIIERQ